MTRGMWAFVFIGMFCGAISLIYTVGGEEHSKVAWMKDIAKHAQDDARVSTYKDALRLSKQAGEMSIFEGGLK